MRYIAQLSRLVWVLNIGLLVVVLFLIVVSVLPTHPSRDTAATVHAKQEINELEARDSQSTDGTDATLILERDIFRVGQGVTGEDPHKAPMVPPERSRKESEQEVPLRLLGTVVDEGGTSYAVIEHATLKRQDVYRAGDAIGEVRIENIEQNSVVVLSAGVRRVLNLALTGREAPAPQVAAQPPAPVQTSTPQGELLRIVSDTERQINTGAPAASLSKGTEFLQKITLLPHQTQGKPDGLTLSGLEGVPLASLAGLKDGDVVQYINGHPILSPTKAAQVLRKARNLGSARIELKRGPESKSLTFHTGSW